MNTYYGRLYKMNPIVVSTICAAAQYITNSGVTFIFSGGYFFFFQVPSSQFTVVLVFTLFLLLLVKQI